MAFRILTTAGSRAARARSSLLLASVAVPAAASVRARVVPAVAGPVRGYASTPEKSSSGSTLLWWGVGLAGAAAGYYFYTSETPTKPVEVAAPQVETPPPAPVKKPLDYTEVYQAIADILEDYDYDDGSFGPVLVRLAWHASGTYNKEDGTGGSNGATMRFAPESEHGANAGLGVARELLEKVKEQFPEISYGDLWTLAGVVAIQEMGGPVIPWRPGRQDKVSAQDCTPDGRLPDASKTQDHVRDIFYRMGFDDQEIVALVGAHALGRCHTDRSGYEGPWTNSPTMFTNDYFVEMLNNKWIEKKWKGPKQFIDKKSQQLMMLPADLALMNDKSFRKYVELYAQSSEKFFEDFAKAFQKLLELGVPFTGEEKLYTFEVSS